MNCWHLLVQEPLDSSIVSCFHPSKCCIQRSSCLYTDHIVTQTDHYEVDKTVLNHIYAKSSIYCITL